nr:MAG TPA: hypothetical protein [Caudoviricetes sp.]
MWRILYTQKRGKELCCLLSCLMRSELWTLLTSRRHSKHVGRPN